MNSDPIHQKIHLFPACLSPLEHLYFPGFDGIILRCDFKQGYFDPTDFSRWGIDFPKTIQASVTKRQVEFFAGRYIASQAQEKLGLIPVQIPIGTHRAPQWPAHLLGSITHHQTATCCVLARPADYNGLGVDLELWMESETAQNAVAMITNTNEEDILAQQGLHFEQGMTLVFSAKESLFKALYPIVQRYFDFLDAELIDIDMTQQTFTLQLLTTLHTDLPAGMRFKGLFTRSAADVLTLIWY